MSVELWWGSGSTPAWRVMMGFAYKGVPYESHLLSFSAGDTRKPEFLALNPRGKVPTVRDGAFLLRESLAILAWLDRRHPDKPLFGTTPEEHGLVWMRCLEYEGYGVKVFDPVSRPILGGRAATESDAIRAAVPAAREELDRLERDVSGGFLVGDHLSAADIVWFAGLQFLLRAATRPAAAALDLGLYPLSSRYPSILAWARRLEAIPGYEATQPPHWYEGDHPSPRRLT